MILLRFSLRTAFSGDTWILFGAADGQAGRQAWVGRWSIGDALRSRITILVSLDNSFD